MEREREREKDLMTERRVTVLIPAGFLPFGRPKKLRIWGGGAVLAGAAGGVNGGLTQQQQAQLMQAQAQGVPSNVLVQMQAQMQAQAGMSLYDREMMMAPGQQPPPPPPPSYPFSQPQGQERRIYTDDSDLPTCAVHAGFVRWCDLAEGRRRGKDMKVLIRIVVPSSAAVPASSSIGIGKYVGGEGARWRGWDLVNAVKGKERERERLAGREEGEVLENEDERVGGGRGRNNKNRGGDRRRQEVREEEEEMEQDGRKVFSGGWGNGHDGSGIEILDVEFVPVRISFFRPFTDSSPNKHFLPILSRL